MKNIGISYKLQKTVFDIETFNSDRAIPYAICMYRPNKISGNINRDITEREYENCRKDYIVFRGTDSINEMLDYVLQFKGEAKKINDNCVIYRFYLHAHKGSGFDS